MSESYNYLIKKYIDYELLDENLNKKISPKSNWDPFIYPSLSSGDNIKFCGVCETAYNKYHLLIKSGTKRPEILWSHLRCGCLWSEYFQKKVKNLNSNVKFIDK